MTDTDVVFRLFISCHSSHWCLATTIRAHDGFKEVCLLLLMSTATLISECDNSQQRKNSIFLNVVAWCVEYKISYCPSCYKSKIQAFLISETKTPAKNIWQLLNQLRKWHNFWTIFSICFTMQNRIGTNKAYHNLFYFNLSMFLASSHLCFQTQCHLMQILLSLSEIWESCIQCNVSQRACTKALVPKVTTCNSSNSEASITDKNNGLNRTLFQQYKKTVLSKINICMNTLIL